MFNPDKSVYLGDGVYASFDGYQIWIAVYGEIFGRGIALERGTLEMLVKYAKEKGLIRE